MAVSGDGWFGLGAVWNNLFGGQSRAKLTEPQVSGLAGGQNAAGKPVTPDTSMQLSTVWACVRMLSETIGTLPVGVYTKDKTGRPTAAPEHGLYGLLHDSPNADQSSVEFWEAVIACLCLWGNYYAEIERGYGGAITALTQLRPDLTHPYRDAFGARRYKTSDPRASARDLPETQVFHVRGFGIGLDAGLSPISYARQTLGTALAADEVAARTFSSGMQVSGFVNAPGPQLLTADQRVQYRELIEKFTGSANAGRVMVLEAGMTWSPLGLNPDDAQLLETRSFHVEEICRWFRVPPFMVGHTTTSTSWGSGLEQQMLGFLTTGVRPYTRRIESAIAKQLLAPADRARVYAQFALDDLLKADSAGRAALYASAAQNGWMSRNEIRAKENLPSQPGADALTVQSNLVPLDKLGEKPPTPTPDAFGFPPKPPHADAPAAAQAAGAMPAPA